MCLSHMAVFHLKRLSLMTITPERFAHFMEEKMNKCMPLSILKDITGIVELCKKTGEPVVVNRNGGLKSVIMTKDIFNEYFRIRKPNGELDIEKKTVITFVKKTF